jgi:AmmeMemoRadiSam system protein B
MIMTLVGCFVTPHPAIIIPEVGGRSLAEAESTVQAMTAVRDRAAELSPVTIVLLSPHSPLARGRMGVSLAGWYKGSLAQFGAPQVKLEAPADQELAQAIVDRAAARGIPLVSTATSQEVFDLDHGAMVPLVYVTGRLPNPFRLVLLSFSYLDLDEHVLFGRAIGEVMMEAEQRVVYVASGDLSHRLIPGAPAGYEPQAAGFDQAIADSFAVGDWEALLSIDSNLVAAAGECGYRSLAVLSGVVEAFEAAGGSAANRLLSYEGPWGVGYLVGEVQLTQPAGSKERRAESGATRTEDGRGEAEGVPG